MSRKFSGAVEKSRYLLEVIKVAMVMGSSVARQAIEDLETYNVGDDDNEHYATTELEFETRFTEQC